MSRKWEKRARIRLQGQNEWHKVEIISYNRSAVNPASLILSGPFIPILSGKQFRLDGQPAVSLRKDGYGLWLDVLSGWRYEAEPL